MKLSISVVLVLLALAEAGHGQAINWRAIRTDHRNQISCAVGYDFGATAVIGYGRSMTLLGPAVLGLEYSFPMGRNLTDDFKVRIGGQMEVLQLGGFSAAVRGSANFRRYQMSLVRIASFGCDVGVLAGYLHPSWYAVVEGGFDKSITSHLAHSALMKDMYPAIRDGWYIPSGGNYSYGIQAGKSIGEHLDLSFRLGVTDAQGDDQDAVLPYYLQLAVGVRF